MRKWMIESFRKFKNRGIKIARACQLASYYKIYKFTVLNFSFVVLGVRCDVDILKLTASAQYINREVYECT